MYSGFRFSFRVSSMMPPTPDFSAAAAIDTNSPSITSGVVFEGLADIAQIVIGCLLPLETRVQSALQGRAWQMLLATS